MRPFWKLLSTRSILKVIVAIALPYLSFYPLWVFQRNKAINRYLLDFPAEPPPNLLYFTPSWHNKTSRAPTNDSYSNLTNVATSIRCYQIFGEPKSGSGLLSEIFLHVFDLMPCAPSPDMRWVDYKGGRVMVNPGEDVLTVVMIRNPIDWILAMYDYLVLPEGPSSKISSNLTISEAASRPASIFTENPNMLLRIREDQARLYFQVFPSLVKNYVLVPYEGLLRDQAFVISNMSVHFNLDRLDKVVTSNIVDEDRWSGRGSRRYKDLSYFTCVCKALVPLFNPEVEGLFGYPSNQTVCSLPSQQAEADPYPTITKFIVVGQRRSGVEMIQKAMWEEFQLEDASAELKDRHLLGKACLGDVANVLFVMVVRDPIQWMMSLYFHPEGMDPALSRHWWDFFFNSFHALPDHRQENGTLNHLRLRTRYASIFQMRQVETSYLLKTLPSRCNHVALVAYESFQKDPDSELDKLQNEFHLANRRKRHALSREDVGNTNPPEDGPYQVDKCLLDSLRGFFTGQDVEREEQLGYNLSDSLSGALAKAGVKDFRRQSIKRFVILGERCSGSELLAEGIRTNLNLEETSQFGMRHFFGSRTCMPFSDDVLFVGVIRDPVDWLHCLVQNDLNKRDFIDLLNSTYVSLGPDGLMEERHLLTWNIYEDAFDLRTTKALYLLDEIQHRVKNFFLVHYEQFRENPQYVYGKLRQRFKAELSVGAGSERYSGSPDAVEPTTTTTTTSIPSITSTSRLIKELKSIVPLLLCKMDKTIESRLGYASTVRALQLNLEEPLRLQGEWSLSCRTKTIPTVGAFTDIF